MFDFSELFNLSFYMQSAPGEYFPTGYFLAFFFGLQYFLRFFLRTLGPNNKYFKKSYRKPIAPFDYVASVGLALVAFRFLDLPGFSMRLWLMIVLLLNFILLIRAAINIHQAYSTRMYSVAKIRANSYR